MKNSSFKILMMIGFALVNTLGLAKNAPQSFTELIPIPGYQVLQAVNTTPCFSISQGSNCLPITRATGGVYCKDPNQQMFAPPGWPVNPDITTFVTYGSPDTAATIVWHIDQNAHFKVGDCLTGLNQIKGTAVSIDSPTQVSVSYAGAGLGFFLVGAAGPNVTGCVASGASAAYVSCQYTPSQ